MSESLAINVAVKPQNTHYWDQPICPLYSCIRIEKLPSSNYQRYKMTISILGLNFEGPLLEVPCTATFPRSLLPPPSLSSSLTTPTFLCLIFPGLFSF